MKMIGDRPLSAIRGVLRDKAVGLVDHVVGKYHHEQVAHVARLEQELSALRDELRTRGDRMFDQLVEFEIRSRRDIIFAGDREAALESNRYARRHMVGARHFGRGLQTLEFAVSEAPDTGGLALEFGVATGETLKVVAATRGGKRVYGFDSFEGLPEDWINGMPAGTFARTDLPDVPGAELVVGWFTETLPDFLKEHGEHVDFLHIDSDLYSSAKTVLELVGPRLRVGSVIEFDEYFNYPGWQEHEHKAWQEYAAAAGIQYRYEAYCYEECQVAVRITAM